MLPQDPFILLSTVNMKLRDEYDSLDDLCAALDADRGGVEETLSAIGFRYDPEQNQFR